MLSLRITRIFVVNQCGPLKSLSPAAMANFYLNTDESNCRNLIISEADWFLEESRSPGSAFAVRNKVYYKFGKNSHIQRFYFRGNNSCNFENLMRVCVIIKMKLNVFVTIVQDIYDETATKLQITLKVVRENQNLKLYLRL